MRRLKNLAVGIAVSIIGLSSAGQAGATVIAFDDSDFALTTTFSDVRTFDFAIDIAAPLRPGMTYVNPALNGVEYRVFGALDSTPSGFSAFDLMRTIDGADFYAQGSSLSFTLSPTANLSDGLQFSELTGADPLFVFNGREVGTGRYHPALLQLNADGSGSLRNSNNSGGVNPGSGEVVDVDVGDEYVTQLSFAPTALTLADAVDVSAPGGLTLLLFGALAATARRAGRRC